ncbi:MAG TPA: orotate phosphoribosyltransferase [Deltaproteobacteria bacterium]|nr:MAG: orotate phosphoribosyltransferase [Deltaproteobacteria bacterium GWA2_45_12]HBF13446.1 orotate phosphoribosyltransferase [Deltaproteobacteria bacterium]
MQSKDQLKALLLTLSYEKREVTLSSGLKSNFYFDGKQTALHAQGSALIGQLMFELISEKMPQVEAVGGLTLGADPLVSAVSVISALKNKPIHAFIIRKEPKQHGTQNWIEGTKNLKAAMKVAILEDVITTGGSSLKAIERAEVFGLDVVGVVSLVDREEGGKQNLEAKGYKVYSLFTKNDLIGDKS